MHLYETAFDSKSFGGVETHCNSVKLPPNSHCAIQMMFIYKIKGVKFCTSPRKYYDVTIAENGVAAYSTCLGPHRKLLMPHFLLTFSQNSLKMYIRK